MDNSSCRRVNRKDVWRGLGLFCLTVLSRVPFRSQILYHWDSVNFAFAMQRFDVAAEQPQPPGYIVYVWLCQLAQALFHDPQTTMVWIAIAGSGLAVVAMYLLGRALFDWRVGVVGALLLASSPLYWFYGEIALPHAVDLFLITLSAWLLYEAAQGHGPCLLAAAVSLAIAGGVRQQTPVFLGLLLLVALIGFFRQVGWATGLGWTVLSALVGGLLCAGWFFPLIASTGGLDRYLQVMGAFSTRFQDATSLFLGAGSFGLIRNVRKLAMYTLYGWGSAFLPFGVWIIARLAKRDVRPDWGKVLFVMAWLIPALFFYVIIHMGQQGLVFVFLPVLLLLGALATVRLLAKQGGRSLSLGVMGIVLLNGLIFVAAPEYPLGGDRLRLLTRATLVSSDDYYQDRFEAIEANFAAESTAVLAASWHHVAYYLPEYVRLPFGVGSKWEIDEGNPTGAREEIIAAPAELGLQLDSQGQAAVVVFDPDLMAFSESPTSVHELPLEFGGALEYYVLTGEQTFHYGRRSFGLVEDQPF